MQVTILVNHMEDKAENFGSCEEAKTDEGREQLVKAYLVFVLFVDDAEETRKGLRNDTVIALVNEL
jgi:hypothetical protein